MAQLAQSGPLAFVAEGRRVVTAGDGTTLNLWEAEARADWARLPAVEDANFGFDARGSMLVAAAASARGPSTLARWLLADARIDQVSARPPAAAASGFDPDRPVPRDLLVLSRDRRTAWAARGETAVAWDSAALRPLFTAEHRPPIDWSTQPRSLHEPACVLRNNVCNTRIAAQRADGSVRVAAVSADGHYAATTRADDVLRIWQLGTSEPLLALPEVDVVALTSRALVLAPVARDEFGKRLDKTTDLRVHGLPGGADIARLAQPDGLREAELAPDGTHLLLVSAGYVQTMLELPGGRVRWQRPGSPWPLRWRFSADGNPVAVTQPGAKERTEEVVVLDVDSGKASGTPIAAPDGALVLALSPDATRLARGSHRDVVVHDVSSGREVARVQHAGAVVDLVFSHDGRTLASASEDGSVRLVDLTLAREIARLAPGGRPRHLAFNPDDTLLAVSGSSGVLAYAWRGADLAREACTRLPESLAPEVWRLYLGNATPLACRTASPRARS